MRTFRKLLESRPAGSGSSPPVFRITSTKLDRSQDRVLALDVEGSEFRVPLLWNHDSWGPPIGYARCFKEGDEWLAEPHFDRADERSRVIADKAEAGSINTCSIGFLPSSKAEPVPNQEGGYDFPLVRVVELSLCNVPANEDAVRVRSVGTEDSPPFSTELLKAYREAHSAFLALASEMKSLAQALTRKAKSAKATEEDEEPDEEQPETVPAGEDLEPEEAADAGEKPSDTPEDEEDEESDAAGADEGEEADAPEDGEAASVDAPEAEEDAELEDAALDEETPDEEDEDEPDAEKASDDAEPSTEEAADSEPGGGDDEEEDGEEDEEELKALRRRVAKGLGFSLAHVEALPSADVRAYAALLPSTP